MLTKDLLGFINLLLFSQQVVGSYNTLPQDFFLFTHVIPFVDRDDYSVYHKLNLTWREIIINDSIISAEYYRVVRLIRPDCHKSCEHGNGEQMQKREIFGIDDREPIRPKHSKIYPQAGVVQISVGCTGMLIDPLHVLTAAHCFHLDGKYTTVLQDVKVGILRSKSVSWFPISKIYLPKLWIRNSGNSLNFDYSVVKLKMPLKRTPTPLGLSVYSDCPSLQMQNNGSYIEFLGFPIDKPNDKLWKSNCTVIDSDYHLLWQECDATYGNSGSGIIARMEGPLDSNNWVTVGVFSGNRYNKQLGRKVNVGIRINLYNFLIICTWSGILKECIQKYSWLFPSVPLKF